MKKYVKPTFEFVELRLEERLAACWDDRHSYTQGRRCHYRKKGSRDYCI